jgi:hypothetical protein
MNEISQILHYIGLLMTLVGFVMRWSNFGVPGNRGN